jgi:hypothetical protein
VCRPGESLKLTDNLTATHLTNRVEQTNRRLFCSKTGEKYYQVRRHEIIDLELEIVLERRTLRELENP